MIDKVEPMNTPVLFLVFNRPDTTRRVFEAIRNARPKRLFVAADGPRENKTGEAERCAEVREIVTNGIDWECEVKTLFRKNNLGCKRAVSSAIDWYFKHVEEGIILEDDCLPDQSFFRFCEELLSKYRDDESVLHIGGTNPIAKVMQSDTYYFSMYNRIWGWATWRRAWQYFDKEIRSWPEIKARKEHYSLLANNKEAKYWEKAWDKVYQDKIDTWDYQWFFCRLLRGKAIIPSVNLVSNIGFNEDATHTTDGNSQVSNLPRGKIVFPLKHPKETDVDKMRDEQWRRLYLHKQGNNITVLKEKIKSVLLRV